MMKPPSRAVEIRTEFGGLCSTGRRFGVSFSQGMANAVPVVVAHVIADQAAKMWLVWAIT